MAKNGAIIQIVVCFFTPETDFLHRFREMDSPARRNPCQRFWPDTRPDQNAQSNPWLYPHSSGQTPQSRVIFQPILPSQL